MEKRPYSSNAKYVIHEHEAIKAGAHWDFRISIPNRSQLASWAIPKMHIPTEPGEKVLLIRVNDHSRLWLQFEGEIESGHGAGTVKILERGTCDIMGWSDKYITLKFERNSSKYFTEGYYILIKMKPRHKKEDEWILMKKKNASIEEMCLETFITELS